MPAKFGNMVHFKLYCRSKLSILGPRLLLFARSYSITGHHVTQWNLQHFDTTRTLTSRMNAHIDIKVII